MMENNCYPFENLPLSYAYDALEPYVDEKTMRLHHDRHLGAYIDKLNDALRREPQLQTLSLERLLTCPLPERRRTEIRRNAGGVYNHRLYFAGMAPGGGRPEGALRSALERQFGSVDGFLRTLQGAAESVFGSGYAWLVWSGRGLSVMTTANQDTPLRRGLVPILTIDVWEHAYYLKHYNKRGDYIADWIKTVDWAMAARRFQNRDRACGAGETEINGEA